MKIALIGATGYVGSALLTELVSRGHEVTALVRHPDKVAAHPGVTVKKTNILESQTLTADLSGHEAVISAFSGFAGGAPEAMAYDQHLEGTSKVLEATRNAGIKRVLIVGGAGSLKVASGRDLVDTAEFPDQWRVMAKATRDALNIVRKERIVDWTFLSPSANLKPGERTGKFRLDLDNLLVNADGESEISVQDYAVAMVNELEQPKHSRMRFTVGY